MNDKQKSAQQKSYEAYLERISCNVYARKITNPKELKRIREIDKKRRPWKAFSTED